MARRRQRRCQRCGVLFWTEQETTYCHWHRTSQQKTPRDYSEATIERKYQAALRAIREARRREG